MGSKDQPYWTTWALPGKRRCGAARRSVAIAAPYFARGLNAYAARFGLGRLVGLFLLCVGQPRHYLARV